MAASGAHQTDLFDSADRDPGSANEAAAGTGSLPLLAIPCGFRDRSNAPCRRLADRIVMIDGEPFHHRGYWIVHCDPACFRSEGSEANGGESAANGRAGGGAGPVG